MGQGMYAPCSAGFQPAVFNDASKDAGATEVESAEFARC